MKEVLLDIISELQDLRASLAVIASLAQNPPTTADALDAKTLAIQQHRQFYDGLKKKVESLEVS